MKLAAIDIGSNAVRLLIAEIFELKDGYHTQKVSFTRIPVRLGEDVFEYGAISHQKSVQLVKVMRAFWYLMDVHNIEFFRACATSAMREASNRKEIIDLIHREGPITPSELARRLESRPATITGRLARLEKTGWITRSIDDRDRRSVNLELTPERRRAMAQVFDPIKDTIKSLADGRTEVAGALVLLDDVSRVVRNSCPSETPPESDPARSM